MGVPRFAEVFRGAAPAAQLEECAALRVALTEAAAAAASSAASKEETRDYLSAATAYATAWRALAHRLSLRPARRVRAPLLFSWRHTLCGGGEASASLVESDASLAFESAASHFSVAAAAAAVARAEPAVAVPTLDVGIAALAHARDNVLPSVRPVLPLLPEVPARAPIMPPQWLAECVVVTAAAPAADREPALLCPLLVRGYHATLSGARERANAQRLLRTEAPLASARTLFGAAECFRVAHELLAPLGGVADRHEYIRSMAFAYHMLARALEAQRDIGPAITCAAESVHLSGHVLHNDETPLAASGDKVSSMVTYHKKLVETNRAVYGFLAVPAREALRVTLNAPGVTGLTVVSAGSEVNILVPASLYFAREARQAREAH